MSYVVANLRYNEFTLGPTAPTTLVCMIQAFDFIKIWAQIINKNLKNLAK